MNKIIQDPYFRVVIDRNGSSPAPEESIWTAQHVCVSDNFAPDAVMPVNPANAIIDHQLRVKHWSVLEFGYVVLHFGGFPHDTVMQLVRHQDSKPMVQSMRYNGKRVIELSCRSNRGVLSPVEELFYAQPAGIYATRDGSYNYTPQQRDYYLAACQQSAEHYATQIGFGLPEELARRCLLSGYRQNFALAGTVRSVFHWLDQRTLADSQLEAQTLAWMALEQLKLWSPGLFEWYEQNRAGKNLLAP